MDPIRFAIENPVKVAVGVILILMFGLLAVSRIPIQLTPSVDRPVVSVTTRWEGASPEEVEKDVILDQEDKLKGIAGLEKMTSICRDSEGQIILEFPVGTDKDAALREVSDKLREVPDYPDNVDEPVIEPSDPNDRDYIAWVIFSTPDPDFDIRHLQKWAEDNIKTELERVRGVSEVNVLGGSEPEVHVRIDPLRLAQFGITPARLIDVIRGENVNISAGDIEEGKLNVRLRVEGRYDSLEQIEQTIISMPDDPVVRVRDVGRAVLTYKEPFAVVRSKGQLALAINAQREVGSNVMRVMEQFRQAIDHLNKIILPTKARSLGLEGGLTLEQVYDQTVYIEQAIALVRNNLFVGGSLAVIVLLLFLRSWRSTAIVALAIPISVIGTFVAMVAMKRNLNVISLAGLAFAVGMVVDNAIVVLENIDRHLKMRQPARQASLRAAREVWGAILASTLTTLAVFIPVIFVEEEAGQLFRDISLAICAAVTLSLIVSVMVIPTSAARFLRDTHEEEEGGPPPPIAPVPRRGALESAKEAVTSAVSLSSTFVKWIADAIYWLTHTWVLRLVLVIGLAGAAVLLSYLLMPPSSYLPVGNRNLVFAALIPPPGYNLQMQERIGKRVESVVGPYWRAEPGSEAAEQLPEVPMPVGLDQTVMVKVPPISNFFFVGLRNGLMFTGAISSDDRRVDPVAALLNHAVQQQPGIFGGARKQPLISTGGGVGNGIELEISGPDLDALTRVAEMMFFSQVGPKFGFQNVRPDPGNFNIPSEQVIARTDKVRASELGLDNAQLGRFIAMLGDGAIVDDYIYEGDTIDLKVITNNDSPNNAMYIRDVPISTPAGRVVPLAAVSHIERTTAPQEIRRIERQRAVTLQVELPDDVALDDAMRIVDQEMVEPLRASGAIPPTVRIDMAGTAAKLRQVKAALLGEWTGFNAQSIGSLLTSRSFLSLVVIFLLLAALFESWFYPAVIMISVPLATVGGFLGLRIVHTVNPEQQLDVLTMLGFIILIGVVVNNAILIVHQALNFMRGEAEEAGQESRQLEPKRAIAESVRTRVRPIFMSTLTSIGGMLPLVLFPGAGSELYRGLGSVVVGGLLVSSVFTLVLVPLVMSLVFDLRTAVAGRSKVHRPVVAAPAPASAQSTAASADQS